MARKIIKAFLFILTAVVVAGGIMTYLRYQKKAAPVATPTPPVQQQAPKITEIKQVTVTSQGQGAQVQIQGISSRNFNISNLPSGDGFKIQVPNAQAKQIQKSFDKPHPLIKSITVNESAENPNTAELVFITEKNVNFLDTQKDDTLTIDFVKTEAEAESAPAVVEKASKATGKSKTASATKASSKKAKAAVSKKTKSSNKTARNSKKPKSSGTVQLKPFDASMIEDDTDAAAEAETLIPQDKGSVAQDKNDRSMDLSAFGTSNPSTESIPLGQEEVPTIEPDNSARTKDPSDNDGFNLKDVVKEEPKAAPAGSANLLDAETEMSLSDNLGGSGQQVAALPNNQKFDLNKIQANLPSLTSLAVQRAGNATMVTFEREKAVPFKVFRMVNPSRVVVDFKDVKNGLKSDYPRFTGTKISRVETRAYAGPDGQIVRVIMYVDGAPNYKSSKSGTSLVLELQ